jgi:aminopeptidase N
MPIFRQPAVILALLLITTLARAAPDLDLDIRLDPSNGQLQASARLLAAPREVSFLLDESLRLTAATVGEQAVATSKRPGPAGYQRWEIRLPRAGQTLHVAYEGRLAPLDRQLDHRGVLRRLSPMSSPEGSFLPSGSAWYPQIKPMMSYRVILSLPGDQRGLVAGRRLAETLPGQPGERYQASFEFLQPTDGIDLMAGPWIVREKTVSRRDGSPLFLRTYFPAGLDAQPGLADAYLDDSARYIERYSREIGDYPYSEFSVVASPLPTGFGMPTLTYLGEAVLRLPFIRQTSLGHEILHNWWGNGVYVDYRRGNWSEGLTTFMADYAYQADQSPAAASAMRLAWLRDAQALPAAEQPALRDFRSRTHGAEAAVGYGKSAMLFVMLRDRIGDAAFDRGIRDFWADRRFTVATWEDLQAAFEKASGEKLGDFFATWVDRRDLPELAIDRAETRPLGQQHRLSLGLRRAGTTATLRLPVELTAPGRREVRWVEVGTALSTVHLDVDFAVHTARLDPDTRLWRRLDATSLPAILRRWTGASAPLVFLASSSPAVSDAARQLARRFFENAPNELDRPGFTKALSGSQPVLLIGSRRDVDRTLGDAGIRPPGLPAGGTAQAWTLPGNDSGAAQPPLAVIAADDAEALRALLRPLPHYGAQSWLVFDQARVVAKGVWPASQPTITVSQLPAAR